MKKTIFAMQARTNFVCFLSYQIWIWLALNHILSNAQNSQHKIVDFLIDQLTRGGGQNLKCDWSRQHIAIIYDKQYNIQINSNIPTTKK